ncbi:MAG: PIG-L deacetylase family protein [Alphaproteobacteria bacterium]
MVVAPHPDDEIIGPGGTLIRLLDSGWQVQVVYLTDGDTDPGIASKRRSEASKVAQALGFEATFLGLTPGDFTNDDQAPQRFIVEVEAATPDVLFIPFLLDDHPDHRDANRLLSEVFRGADRRSGRLEVWAYQVYTPLPGNVVVDITAEAGRKADTIRMFGTQMATRDWVHFALGLNAFNLRLLPGTKGARYVEAFFVLPLSDYIKLCDQYFVPHGDG